MCDNLVMTGFLQPIAKGKAAAPRTCPFLSASNPVRCFNGTRRTYSECITEATTHTTLLLFLRIQYAAEKHGFVGTRLEKTIWESSCERHAVSMFSLLVLLWLSDQLVDRHCFLVSFELMLRSLLLILRADHLGQVLERGADHI